MIKLGFKLFGCSTVFLFVFIGAIFVAMSTVPPVYSVRSDIIENVYPVARENLKDKFSRFVEETRNCSDVGRFEISEIELNSYLYWWANDIFVPGGVQVFNDPYLFVKDGELSLRFDIPINSFLQILNNRLAGRDLDETISHIKDNASVKGTLSVTMVLKVFWVEKEERPYFYLDRFYVGVLPIPIPVIMSDYQDQVNRMITDFYENNMNYFPVYIKKIESVDKALVVETELKITERVGMVRAIKQFEESNPDLASALDSRKCLYGCTEDERQALDKWMEQIRKKEVNDLSMEEVIFFRMAKGKMVERKQQQIHNIHQGFDWEAIRRNSPQDKDWGFRHFPDPNIHGHR